MLFEKLKIYAVPVLSIAIYLLIYLIRTQQTCLLSSSSANTNKALRAGITEGDCRWGGSDMKLDLFPQVRQSLDQKIARLLPSPQAELLSGIVLGNKKSLPGSLKLALRDSSTLHIVVVSGSNLTLLAGLFMNLSGLLKRKIAILLSIGAVIFYVILTGGQIPVLRAAIMAILSFSAQIFGRVKDGVWVLIVTGALMLLINPGLIADLSFQLSFMATLGVIVAAPIIEKKLKFLPEFIKLDLAISIGAELMVMPIIAQNFHQISLVGIFANLLVGWIIPFVMAFGTLMIFFGSVFVIITSIFLTYFIYVVQSFASLPFAWEYLGEQVWIVWVGYYLVLAGIMLSLNYDKKENS